MNDSSLDIALAAVREAGRDEILAQVRVAVERIRRAEGQARTFKLNDVAESLLFALKIITEEVSL